MAKNDLDLSKLKEEIESRKTDRGVKDQKLGIESNTQEPQNNNFLKGLVDAYKSMNENDATKHIKQVATLSDQKSTDPIMDHAGTPNKSPKKNTQSSSQYSSGGSMYDIPTDVNKQTPPSQDQQQPINENMGGNDRDAELYAEIQRRSEEYNKRAGKEIFPQPQQNTYQPNNTQPSGDFRSSVVSILEEYLGNNLRQIVKEVVYEIYVNENVKNGIVNNEEVIKDIVINTIKSLKKKKSG